MNDNSKVITILIGRCVRMFGAHGQGMRLLPHSSAEKRKGGGGDDW